MSEVPFPVKPEPPKPEADPDAAVDFLQRWAPDGPWVLTGIRKERKFITTETFRPGGEAALRDFLGAQGVAEHNIYFHVNSPTRDLTKKAGREDIASVDWLHVDVDPRAGEDLSAERTRIQDRFTNNLPAGVPAPSVIIFSGGGYQGFWKLEEPIPINGDLDLAEDAARYNQKLEALFEGDNCHNIDRIMRLPGTINWPDARKIKKGRVPTLARLITFGDTVFTLGAFEKASAAEASEGRAGPVDVGSAKQVADLSELDHWAVGARVKIIIEKGRIESQPKTGDDSDNAWLYDACCQLCRHGVPDSVIYSIITDQKWGISAHVLAQGNVDRCARKHIRDARKEAVRGPLLLYKGVPMHTAREFVSIKQPSLMHYNDDFLAHVGTAYRDLENATIKSNLWKFCEGAQRPGKQKKVKQKKPAKDAGGAPVPELTDDPDFIPFNPTKTDVLDALDALKGIAHIERDTFAPPCYLDGRADPDPRDILACRNGLLHLPTMTLMPPDTAFFTRNALDFDYDPDPPAPVQWLAFLTDLFGDDEHQIRLLQEIIGYLLVPDLSQHKMFIVKGPPRSGKGTIARITERLVGTRNTCSPSMSSFSDKSGLEPLIGKQLAIVSDMRLGRQTDRAAVTETLLKISGEDSVSAFRKFKAAWEGTLGVRFLILTNEDFALKDSSGALANRFVGITLTNSFLGKEDLTLTSKLCAELPGILLWAIEGLERLNEQGHFTSTAQSTAIVRDLHAAGDQVAAFFHECCELDPPSDVPKGKMYENYKTWATANGRDEKRLVEVRTFGKDFLACGMGRIKVAKLGARGDRYPAYTGVKLIAQGDRAEHDDREVL